MQSTQESNLSDLMSLTYDDASGYSTPRLAGKDSPLNNYVTVNKPSATPTISADVDSLRYDNDGYLQPDELMNTINPLYNRRVNSATGQTDLRLPDYDVAVARKAILSQPQQPVPSARQSTASSTSAMRGELKAPSTWRQSTKTESRNPIFEHPYEELPPKPNNGYLTITSNQTVEAFPPHPVITSTPSVDHRKADNPLYGEIGNTHKSATSTTEACGGNVVQILVILIIIMSLIAVAALVMAAYSVSMVWRTGNSNNVPMNATVNVDTLKEQIQQLQQENLLLPIKIAKLLGFDLPPDNSSLMLSDLLTNSSQIVAMLSDKVIHLIASTADGYRNLSSQTNNLTATLALITQQQLLQQSNWSNQLTFVQTNLTARIDALSRLPGPQGPPGPATTVNLANCSLNTISSGGVIQLQSISTRAINPTTEYPDQIVTGVTCTTDFGSSALLNSDASNTKYSCTCSGSTSLSATSRFCFMNYWLCPRIFRGG